MKTPQPMIKSNFGDLTLLKRGKVRDIYDLGKFLLLVATDRISAFDVVMNKGITGKGKILNLMTLYSMRKFAGIIPNHLVTSLVSKYPDECQPYAEELAQRSVLVRKCEPLTIECVVRGYISGSGWKAYQETGEICGIALPSGLVESQQLEEPIFTPSTKADEGHDINIPFEEACKRVGDEVAQKVKEFSLMLYQLGADLAEKKGIIIADTKFEFGHDPDGNLVLIDEVLTPDSSRFWPKASYKPGGPQPSFDKQYLRDYLSSLDWDKTPPPPTLPADVIAKTREKYLEALRRITNLKLQ